MRALITNDDGISSAGIRALARVAVAAGLEVTVAAPIEARRRYGTALSALEDDGRLIVEEYDLDVPDGGTDRGGGPDRLDVTALAVQASPSMIVFVAAQGGFGEPPDIVLSGINLGANTGQAVLHSGTVGAALTAASLGLPAMAVSLGTEGWTEWSTAADVSARALRWFLAGPADDTKAPYVLNVNVPDVPLGRLRGVRQAELASFGAVQAEIGERGAGYLTMSFTQIDDEGEAGTDVALLRNGWATVTALQAPARVDGLDLSSL